MFRLHTQPYSPECTNLHISSPLPQNSPSPLHQRDRLGSTDSRVLDGEDLLDDVLTAPAAAPPRTMGHTPTNEDEVGAPLSLHVLVTQ